MTTWLLVILFSGCNSKSTVEKPNKTFEVEDDHSGHSHSHTDGGGDAEGALLDSNAWKQELDKPDAADRLIAYANSLRIRRPQVSPEQQKADRISLIEIGDELQKRELTEPQQFAAFQIKSRTLMEYVAEGLQDYRDPLVKYINESRNHPNPEIARSAEFLELSLVIQDYFNDENKDFSKAEETIVNMAKAHPDDPEVVNTISGTVANLLTLGQRDQTLTVMRKLAEVYADSKDPSAQRIANIYEDRVFMVESKFDKVATDTKKGVDGALEKYQEAIRVLAQRQGHEEFYAETVLGIRFLEQLGLIDDARELYEILARTYEASDDPAFVEQSKRDVERGNRRLDLVGIKPQFIGNLPDGTAFDPDVLKDKVVVVFFWSVGVPESPRLMAALARIYRDYKDLGFEVVSICIDKDVQTAVSIFNDRLPPWHSLFQHDEEAYQKMIDEYGIQMLPYTLIIDKTGVVTDIHVQESDLISTIGRRLNLKDVPANAAEGR